MDERESVKIVPTLKYYSRNSVSALLMAHNSAECIQVLSFHELLINSFGMWMAQAAVWWSWFTEPSVNMLIWSSLSSAVNNKFQSCLGWIVQGLLLSHGEEIKVVMSSPTDQCRLV